MKNSKVKQFEAKVNQIVESSKAVILTDVENYLSSFNEISFETFSSENPYVGMLKNKIFFTYSDHYRANSGTWMEVGKLSHPHLSYEDRGYIKGAATDLDGYMKLKSANGLNHNFDCVCRIYYPRFHKSANSDQYKAECDAIAARATKELNQCIEEQKKMMNNKLKELTGCSLLHYLRNI